MGNGKVVLVTGSSRGIGRGLALGFAKAGYDVAVHYCSAQDEGKRVQSEVEALGVRTCLLSGNTGEANVPERLIAETVAQLGCLDVFVANAGIFRDVCLMELTPELIDEVYTVNFRGVILGAGAAARYFVKNKIPGNILFNTSVRAFNAHSGDGIYGGLKAGINRAIESFACDLGRYGIRVNGFAPGVINISCPPGEEESAHPFYGNTHRFIPLRKNGCPKDVAEVAVWLASDAAAYVTGAVIKVDAGLSSVGAPEGFNDLYNKFDLKRLPKQEERE